MANPPKIEVVPEKSKDKSEKVSEQPENYAGLDPRKSAERLKILLSNKADKIGQLSEPPNPRSIEELKAAQSSVDRRRLLANEINLSLAA